MRDFVMDRVAGKLTVLFEDPFWIGIFERIAGFRDWDKITAGIAVTTRGKQTGTKGY